MIKPTNNKTRFALDEKFRLQIEYRVLGDFLEFLNSFASKNKIWNKSRSTAERINERLDKIETELEKVNERISNLPDSFGIIPGGKESSVSATVYFERDAKRYKKVIKSKQVLNGIGVCLNRSISYDCPLGDIVNYSPENMDEILQAIPLEIQELVQEFFNNWHDYNDEVHALKTNSFSLPNSVSLEMYKMYNQALVDNGFTPDFMRESVIKNEYKKAIVKAQEALKAHFGFTEVIISEEEYEVVESSGWSHEFDSDDDYSYPGFQK